MQERPEGPDPPQLWTCADIERWLIVAFKAMPYVPIYAPRPNTLTSVNRNIPSATFDIVAFSGTVLGERSEERKIVLLWARALATEGAVGGSISQFCAARGWDRRKFDRRRIKACELITAAKNEADGRR